MISPSQGAALNPKTSNPKPNSNTPPKPWELDSDFHMKTHSVLSFFSCNFQFWFS
jgi:hypothetical protein